MFYHTHSNKAFTLIELLVVIVIIGILATISVSTFQGYFEKARLAKAQNMASQLQKILLAKDASTENNFITAWYDFEGNSVSNTSPFVLDKMPTNNHLLRTDGLALLTQSDDTGSGSGKSLHIEGNLYRMPAHEGVANHPVEKITMASWFKITDLTSTRYIFFFNSTRIQVLSNGYLAFNYNGNMIGKSNAIKLNKWYYAVASYDGNNMKLWLDGDLVAQKENVSPSSSLATEILYVSNNFHGYIDNSIISPYAFDGNEFK